MKFYLQSETLIATKRHTATKQTFTKWLATQSLLYQTYIIGDHTIFAAFGTHTPSKFNDLKAAYDKAKQYLKEAVDYLQTYIIGDHTIFAAFGTHTPSKFNDLKAAHDKAKQYLKEAVDYLQDQKRATLLYEKWFGELNQENYDEVKKNFVDTKNGLNHPYVYNILPEKLCGKDVLAAVDATLKGKKQHVVNVCPLFFKPSTELDEQIITIIHEMTHDSAATEDEKLLVRGKQKVCYNEQLCNKLAKDDPKRAIVNADNYARFAIEVKNARQEL